MAKNSWVLPVVLLAGGYIFYAHMGGKKMINDLIGGGGNGGSGSDMPTVDGIGGQVQSMIDKIKNSGNDTNNINFDSGKNSQINRQSNTGTGGTITQTRSVNQKSSSFFTMPRRFSNL